MEVGRILGRRFGTLGTIRKYLVISHWFAAPILWYTIMTVNIASCCRQLTGSILNLHHNHASLYITSPLFLSREGVWDVLAREPDGRAVLERSRDAAMAVVNAICSVSTSPLYPTNAPVAVPSLAHFFFPSAAQSCPSPRPATNQSAA